MTARSEELLEAPDKSEVAPTSERSDALKAVALRAYSGHRRRAIGDDEIVELLPMVRKIAHRAASYLRPPLSFDDLISAGTVGLLKAARDFDASHQAEFRTYAYIRIKGAVLDELRRASPLPSNVNRQVRLALRASQRIVQQTGSPPTDEQLAEELNIPVDEVGTLFENARAQHFVSIDGFGEEQPALGQILASADTAGPDARLEKAEMLKKLTAAMQELDPRRLQIVVLYYHKHLTMKQIADLLEITESRVSQLHASALVILSGKLGEYSDDGQ
ncbi:sigma-70 family RNA polymerase sigma factor [Anaerobaca lacustris]|uniref:RNA polymerase sigma factor n=1 Tax=Anaerobaca lacustris TaxID=3044600 RepID=A0AAW6TXC7_9BACT|nr:sigma-70 family RNA polymerase sigma factor [Sedimentisphaerales bacterium M17dextr]